MTNYRSTRRSRSPRRRNSPQPEPRARAVPDARQQRAERFGIPERREERSDRRRQEVLPSRGSRRESPRRRESPVRSERRSSRDRDVRSRDRRREDLSDRGREGRGREDRDRQDTAREQSGRRGESGRREDRDRSRGNEESRRADSRTFPGSCTVWVGSVPEGVLDEQIFDEMLQFGTIEGMRMVAQRGFGYVRYSRVEEAETAQKGLCQVAGKRLRIDACEQMPQIGHPYKPVAGSKPPLCQTLFVGNLAADTSEEELRDFFAPHPVMSVNMRKGGYKGLCFAHVRFDSPAVCEAAILVAGNKLRNTRLRLDWAVDKASHGGQATGDIKTPNPRVYVGGLNERIEEDDIRTAFEPFGEISFLRIHLDKFGAKSFGYVTFTTTESATAAIDANIFIKGEKIRADYARLDRAAVSAPVETLRHSPVRSTHVRVTPISTELPEGYESMRTWEQCYGQPNGVSIH